MIKRDKKNEMVKKEKGDRYSIMLRKEMRRGRKKKRAYISNGRPASLFSAVHPFRRGPSIPRNESQLYRRLREIRE